MVSGEQQVLLEGAFSLKLLNTIIYIFSVVAYLFIYSIYVAGINHIINYYI